MKLTVDEAIKIFENTMESSVIKWYEIKNIYKINKHVVFEYETNTGSYVYYVDGNTGGLGGLKMDSWKIFKNENADKIEKNCTISFNESRILYNYKQAKSLLYQGFIACNGCALTSLINEIKKLFKEI